MSSVVMDSDDELDIVQLLTKRRELTQALLDSPYDLILYLKRAIVYSDLGYPDLAAGDGYRALLLCDEVRDEDFEYHDQALSALRTHIQENSELPILLRQHGADHVDLHGGVVAMDLDGGVGDTTVANLVHRASIRCYQILSISLLLCGSLKSALDFCTRGLATDHNDEELLQAKEYILEMGRRKLKSSDVDINDLPDQGLARREVYPWNDHEPDRYSDETLRFLNKELSAVSSNCEVKATELPTLLDGSTGSSDTDRTSINSVTTNLQLGVFAKRDIAPGEMVLDEYSVLTANNRLKDTLCDACSTELPPLASDSGVVGCPDCDDIMFCNEECLGRAQESYHPAVCDMDIDAIGKDPDPKESPNALYLLLLARSFAMAATQECHPLDLKEVKYIWGDFLPSAANAFPTTPRGSAGPPPIWTLPFSFAANISGPLHVLEKMDIDIYASIANYDLWIFNTLYSKFRGTASARVSLRDGRPEVAAVHPLWCLANHDCDPNVQWEWGGRMRLWTREKRYDGRPGGIKSGEEILNHYCDIDLKVQDRREWANGSLGGWCMCNRCKRESAEEDEKKRLNGHDAELEQEGIEEHDMLN
ncbi:Wd tetratricopeptide repeat-containing protein [Coleophoma cylindrospora]|uniref:Wd tetratricopeptide repeat-containing protein n=1 Tax=Coleophoma cylindrospora TaxID=1849047 RepID=A0A3D8RB65_9HELO|nr:Wd tetratricopeptide repeat-containing protein [Coleophoma cylindrospora]